MGGRRTPSSHAGTELPSRGLSEAPRQGHGPTRAARAARELRLCRLLPPRQQIQSWPITEWNKTQQCNKISRRLVHLQPSSRGSHRRWHGLCGQPRVWGARRGEGGFEMALGELPAGHSSSRGSRAEGESRISEQGRAADSLRSGEVKSNCAASTAAINLSVYSRGRPSLSA